MLPDALLFKRGAQLIRNRVSAQVTLRRLDESHDIFLSRPFVLILWVLVLSAGDFTAGVGVVVEVLRELFGVFERVRRLLSALTQDVEAVCDPLSVWRRVGYLQKVGVGAVIAVIASICTVAVRLLGGPSSDRRDH